MSLQSSIIALRTKDILFICCIQFILAARPIFFFQFGRVETNIGHNIMVMAKGGSTIWLLHCCCKIPGM